MTILVAPQRVAGQNKLEIFFTLIISAIFVVEL